MGEIKTIYIILTNTGTLLSRMIRLYTREELNHTSIAFDDQLTEVYSFGRKDQRNPFNGGFVRENIRGELFINERRQTRCAIYRCKVSKQSYYQIREQIKNFEKNSDQYSYNLLGLFGVVLNIEIDTERTFFCSQFVSYLFQCAGDCLVNKPTSLVTPKDIANSNRLQPYYQGNLKQYIDYRRLPVA